MAAIGMIAEKSKNKSHVTERKRDRKKETERRSGMIDKVLGKN